MSTEMRADPGRSTRLESDDHSVDTVCIAPLTDAKRRSTESIAALADAAFGVRGLPGNAESVSWSATFASDAYTSEEVPQLLRGPMWTGFSVEPRSGWTESVTLDLRAGVVRHVMYHDIEDTEVRITRFLSAADGGIGVQIITGPISTVAATDPLRRPSTDAQVEVTTTFAHGVELMSISDAVTCEGIAVAAHDDVTDSRERRTVTRLVGLASGSAEHAQATALHRLDQARRLGPAELERRHRDAWATRWERCGTWLESRPAVERAIRFATFHLLCAGSTAVEPAPGSTPESNRDIAPAAPATPVDDAAIGARGLTGPSYRGHVFWDTDVFVLPALSAIEPDGARRALDYRWARMEPARTRAAADGRNGVRFPWESARTGDEVTPRRGRDLAGNPTTIRTGELEEHITADVAWAVCNHVDWTGDDAYLRTRGLDILVATARYWASRVEVDDDGSGHIRNVIGPDEYHEAVDDNTFTNVMARHNLLRSADAAERFGVCADSEVRSWRRCAEAIVDGFDPRTGLYEQFRGYHDLAPTLVSSIGDAPLPADAILGHDGVAATQILKQPDVLMTYHLVPERMRPDALDTNLDYYGPRTAHGSSLSPAIMASLLFRARRWDDATSLFELAATLDLDDVTGTTAGGLHLATMGGLWQAVTCGLLGMRPTDAGLTIDPCVPPALGTVRHRVMYRGAPITATIDGDVARVESPVPVYLLVGGEQRRAAHHRLAATDTGWEHR